MKFMLMMNAPGGDAGDWNVSKWSPAELGAHIRFMKNINEELRASGNLVDAQGLAPPNQARVVRASKADAPEITNGPFAETKEFLAGYWIVDVESEVEAFAIAARVSVAPGKDGAPMRIPVEVRQVMSAPAVDG